MKIVSELLVETGQWEAIVALAHKVESGDVPLPEVIITVSRKPWVTDRQLFDLVSDRYKGTFEDWLAEQP